MDLDCDGNPESKTEGRKKRRNNKEIDLGKYFGEEGEEEGEEDGRRLPHPP